MVCVVANTGKPLMPTSEYRARKLLKKGRARIYKRNPFTIEIIDREDGATQEIEYRSDTGYQHVGVSVCTEKKELVSEEYNLLTNETEQHDDCRKYRRARRNRKRYRKPRFNNRRRGMICKDGFAPGIRNRRDRQIDIFTHYYEVTPITRAYLEMGDFDTQVLVAVEAGRPVPSGLDYQHGPQYGFNTLRAAVFARDGHTCQVCGNGVKNGAILRVHHLGYLTGDHTDRMSNLLTVCTKCHTPKNHKKGGKLYGLKPKLKPFKGATFMTAVRWNMIKKLKAVAPDVEFRFSYGQATKDSRKVLKIKKTHANDAYALGTFHPKWRAHTVQWKKRRRNNRILEYFYDAKYVDIRDGEVKSGAQLSCGRTNRSESRHGPNNERVYRGRRLDKRTKSGKVSVSCGRRNIRDRRYPIQPGDSVWIAGKRYTSKGTHNKGTRVLLNTGKSVAVSKIQKVVHVGGWLEIR